MNPVFEKAFSVLDSVDAQRVAWEAERAAETDDQRFARENVEADAYLALRTECRRLEQAEPENRLIFKQYEPKTESAMTDSDRQWVMQQLEAFADIIGEETAKNESKVAKVLREEIAVLRSEIESLKKASKPDASIAGSVTSLRGRNVA